MDTQEWFESIETIQRKRNNFRISLAILALIEVLCIVVVVLVLSQGLSVNKNFLSFMIFPQPLFIATAAFILLSTMKLSNRFDILLEQTEMFEHDDLTERMEAILGAEIVSVMREKSAKSARSRKAAQRGGDEKGWTSGVSEAELSTENQTRDAAFHGQTYDGLEGELTKSEMMMAEANEIKARIANAAFIDSEANDPDLIEAGVKRLGDLVGTDYFEKNPDIGGFERLVKSAEETQQ